MADKKSGVELIAAERARQVEVEGWTPEHDAKHAGESLAMAACCYVLPTSMRKYQRRAILEPFQAPDRGDRTRAVPVLWPWHPNHWKPTEDRVRDLVKAGALIAAEIDRLQRAGGENGGNVAG
jgi:hypothetical protein